MRRFTSGAEPFVARPAVHRPSAVIAARRGVRTARRRSAPGSSSLPRWPPGSRRESRSWRAAGRCRRASRPRAAASRAPRRTRGGRLRRRRRSTNARGTPIRSPLTSPVSAAREVGHRLAATRSRRAGSGPARTPSVERRVGGRPRDRADLIERRGERQQAVAGDAAVGRLQADDAAERRRLADRSAGVGAERQRRAARGDRRRRAAARAARACDRSPTDSARGRTRSSRWTIPSRTRRSSSCRR